MHALQIGPQWASQIAAIRDAHTEDSNLIRFDNGFYRCCRASGAPFTVALSPAAGMGSAELHLVVDPVTFYVASIGGTPMGRYASTLLGVPLNAARLSSAVGDLAGGRSSGGDAFLQRSQLVFAVAESIRFDLLATALEQSMRAMTMQIKGVNSDLNTRQWWDFVHDWGQACDAIHGALSGDMRAVVGRPRAQLTDDERRRHQIVDLSALGPRLRDCARATKVLKRPGVAFTA